MKKQSNRKFEQALTTKIKLLEPYVTKVLKALDWDINDVLVTDESYISDFLNVFDVKEGNTTLKKAEKKLGILIKRNEYIWTTAERLYDYTHENIKSSVS